MNDRDDLRAYVERDYGFATGETEWRWRVVDGRTIVRGITATRFGARWAARRALKRIRAVRDAQREEIR